MQSEHGNTGFQVAPVSTPTESEMEQVRSVFQRMADAVVGAASLTKEVEELRKTVQSLQWDTESLRRRNKELDEQVAEVRRQRDEAKEQADRAHAEAVKSENDLLSAHRELENTRRDRDDLKKLYDEARKDRDDASFRNLELTEERDAAKADLDQIINILRPVMNKVENEKNVPQPTPAPEPQDGSYKWPNEPQNETIPVKDDRPWWEKNNPTF